MEFMETQPTYMPQYERLIPVPEPTLPAPWTVHRIANCVFVAGLTAVIVVGADRIIHEAWRTALGVPDPLDD